MAAAAVFWSQERPDMLKGGPFYEECCFCGATTHTICTVRYWCLGVYIYAGDTCACDKCLEAHTAEYQRKWIAVAGYCLEKWPEKEETCAHECTFHANCCLKKKAARGVVPFISVNLQ